MCSSNAFASVLAAIFEGGAPKQGVPACISEAMGCGGFREDEGGTSRTAQQDEGERQHDGPLEMSERESRERAIGTPKGHASKKE